MSDAIDLPCLNTISIVVLVFLLLNLGGSFESFAANNWFEEVLLCFALNAGSLFF
jgi:hypothetical protein